MVERSDLTAPVEIIAHRGASWDAPENTLTAFRLGFLQGADAVELDVRLSLDGKIAVVHDADTGRVSGETKRVAEHAFQEIRELEVGAWGRWNGQGFSESIPELGEVLALVPDGRRVFIEIKCGAEILRELPHTLEHSGLRPGQIVLMGFDHETMRAAKAILPDFDVLWLVTAGRGPGEYPQMGALIEQARAANFDGFDLEKGFPIDRSFVQRIHEAGLKLYTWTVDDVRIAHKEMASGVDGITTNRPGWLREQLGRSLT